MTRQTSLREKLQAQLARFDDDAFAALANRGLLRRARKDLEKEAAQLVEETPTAMALTFGGHRIDFDARGVAHARCSCPANGVCQHILAAAITLAAPARADESPPADAPADADVLEPLRAALLALKASELGKHAGKAGYRWAWQFVQDLNAETDLTISGERNLVIAFRHPRLAFRYMGGGLDSLLADVDIKQVEKYRVAAVLAFQRAHGQEIAAPETDKPQTAALDLGKDHALAESTPAALAESRARLAAAIRQLGRECVTLGLSHFSPGIQERFSTLAVWAQGAQCYRLALLLRRIADHVEMLLERAGGADEHRLFDELTLAYALVTAIESAASRGSSPMPLLGRARNEYEDAGQLELLGLGSHAWRSASGYLGLTQLFWSPADKSFYSNTDARPEVQRGFDPVARYQSAGPWSGFGGPALATGRRLVLTGALTSANGRISGSEKTSAALQTPDSGLFIEQLRPIALANWSELARLRAAQRRSLLSEPQPMKDWVVLKPARFVRADFDATRQTLVWGMVDDEGAVLRAELIYDKYTTPAIERIERLEGDAADAWVVARLRGGSSNFIAEPLSLVNANARGEQRCVDSLYFDAAPRSGFVSKLFANWRRRADETGAPPVTASATPPVLADLHRWLRLQAERGVAWEAAAGARTELASRLSRLHAAGFTAFASTTGPDAAGELLRAQYLCLQYEHLLDDSGEVAAAS